MKIRRAGRIATWVLDRFEFDAIVSPWRTIYIRRKYYTDKELRRHEVAHLLQMDRDGWLKFWVLIIWYYVVYGYERSPYEVEARAAAADASHPLWQQAQAHVGRDHRKDTPAH